jgi:hypothetical protein
MYSRGYKNCTINKKCLEISPIFNDGIECQLFKLMTFFVSLLALLDPFFSQSVHVGRYDMTTFFLSLQFFYKSKNNTRYFKTLSKAEKVRLMAW